MWRTGRYWSTHPRTFHFYWRKTWSFHLKRHHIGCKSPFIFTRPPMKYSVLTKTWSFVWDQDGWRWSCRSSRFNEDPAAPSGGQTSGQTVSHVCWFPTSCFELSSKSKHSWETVRSTQATPSVRIRFLNNVMKKAVTHGKLVRRCSSTFAQQHIGFLLEMLQLWCPEGKPVCSDLNIYVVPSITKTSSIQMWV